MQLQNEVSKVLNSKADHEIRVMRNHVVGTVPVHQGDVYLHAVSSDWPRGAVRGTRKIAVGENEGSTHVVEGDVEVYEGVKLPEYMTGAAKRNAVEFLGPVVVVGEGGALLTHVKHAHHRIPCGVYQTTYQVDGERRVKD